MAVTLGSYGPHTNENLMELYGKSTDVKPIGEFEGMSIPNGSSYFEIDTIKLYFYDAEKQAWESKSSSDGDDSVFVSPDWNQNDNASTDYIKNRTHYTQQGVKETIFKLTDTFEGNASTDVAIKEIPLAGTSCTVVFDGVTYELVASEGVFGDDKDTSVILGNKYLERDSLDNTGEPFCFYFHKSSDLFKPTHLICSADGIHTISLAWTHDAVHRLDACYMPETFEDSIYNLQQFASGAIKIMSVQESDSSDETLDIKSLPNKDDGIILVYSANGEYSVNGRMRTTGVIDAPYHISDIISCKTGKKITAEELPYFCEVIVRDKTQGKYICLNPL